MDEDQELKKMKESNKNNSTSWWNNPALAEQPKMPVTVTKNNNGEDILIDANHRQVNFEVSYTEPTESLEPAIEVAPTLPKKRGRPEKVSKDIFQEVWNKCETLDEVAETLGLPRTSVSVKASNMRKLGCTMKRMKKARKTSC